MVVRELITLLGFKVNENGLQSYQKGIDNAKWAVAGLGAGVAAAGIALLKMGGDMEQTAVSFEVMLGSADKAKSMISDKYKMGAKTPFESADLVENAQLLLNFGTAAEDVIPTLSKIGDVAAGDANKLHSLSLVFAQVSSAGKLQGGDLLQMINAGFNPLQIISEKTGKSMGQLRKEMESGAISADMVKDAFKSVTSEGGRFYKMMEKQSDTLLGRWSTLKDGVSMIGTAIGTELLPYAKEWLAEGSKILDNNKELITSGVAKFFVNLSWAAAVVYGALKILNEELFGIGEEGESTIDVVGMVTDSFIFLLTWAWKLRWVILMLMGALIAYKTFMLATQAVTFLVTAAQAALNAVMSANPIGLMVAGIAALVVAGVLLYRNWDKVAKFFKGLWDGPLSGKALRLILAPIMPFILAGKWIYDNWEPIKGFFSDLWDSVASGAEWVYGKIKPVIDAAKAIAGIVFPAAPRENKTGRYATPPGAAPGKTGSSTGGGGGNEPKPNKTGYAQGSSFVGQTGWAMVHRGEKIYTADEVRRGADTRGSRSGVNVNSNINITVPSGTTESQANYIRNIVKRQITESWQGVLRQADASNLSYEGG
jgi:tape measure domain-containing protein